MTHEPAPTRELLQQFCERHRALLGDPYVPNYGKDGKILKDLIGAYGAERVSALMAAFFETTDPFVQENGYTVGMFRSHIPKLIVREQAHRLPQGEAKAFGRPTVTEQNLRGLREDLAALDAHEASQALRRVK